MASNLLCSAVKTRSILSSPPVSLRYAEVSGYSDLCSLRKSASARLDWARLNDSLQRHTVPGLILTSLHFRVDNTCVFALAVDVVDFGDKSSIRHDGVENVIDVYRQHVQEPFTSGSLHGVRSVWRSVQLYAITHDHLQSTRWFHRYRHGWPVGREHPCMGSSLNQGRQGFPLGAKA